jgi:DNA-binding NtrC family response regulator
MTLAPTASDPSRLLIVEDDEPLCDMIASELSDRGYRVDTAFAAQPALAALRSGSPDLVLTDLRLPDGSGFDVLAAALAHDGQPAVLLITAFGSVPQAVEALKAGADDFLTKPLDLEHLAVRLERALAHRRTNVMLRDLRETLRDSRGDGMFRGMIGQSPIMRQLFAKIRQVARVEEPVLVTGETGTGKELVANAIHAESERASRPFIAVNCASIPETLLEAEFFGHTAGAFTGARNARRGLFAEADKGTLFLDEIGELPPPLQAKLLRTLQEQTIRPIGAARETPVDTRIIAATNRDIVAEVADGRWREDLYYRLEALTLDVPPLRERGDDRAELIKHFLVMLASDRNQPGPRLAEPASDALLAYHYPGNVRELGNALARAATFCENGVIELRHLPERIRGALRPEPAGSDPLGIFGQPPPTLAEVEKRYIQWILARTGQNKRQAARILNVGRRTVYRKLDSAAD